MVDTNSQPEGIDFVIPANDDASQSINLIVKVMTDAIREGLSERKVEREKEGEEKEIKIKGKKVLVADDFATSDEDEELDDDDSDDDSDAEIDE
jgi:small subunit ribosomal protein S2